MDRLILDIFIGLEWNPYSSVELESGGTSHTGPPTDEFYELSELGIYSAAEGSFTEIQVPSHQLLDWFIAHELMVERVNGSRIAGDLSLPVLNPLCPASATWTCNTKISTDPGDEPMSIGQWYSSHPTRRGSILVIRVLTCERGNIYDCRGWT